MDTNGNEWTKAGGNHEKHENHEKAEGRARTTNGHEWTRMAKEISNHEKHENHEKAEGRARTTNGHEWPKAGVATKDMKWHSQAFLGNQ